MNAKINDWIKIEEPHRSASYTEAHVYGITDNGNLRIAYGSKNQDSFFWLYMGGNQTVSPKFVSEIWRKNEKHEWIKVN